MAAINYATQYQQALQQVFTSELRFTEAYSTPNNNQIKWTNAKTIQVPNIAVGGFVDVNRDAITNFSRKVDNSWIPFTLTHDREFSTFVDPNDVDETNMALTISNITQVFNREQKIPEMDKYLASKLLADWVAAGGVKDTTVLTANNVLTVFDTFMEQMDDAEVPTEGRILYVTPQVNTLIKNAQQIQRRLDVTGGAAGVNRNIRSLEEVTVKIVPSSRMKSLYNFTSGAVVDVAAKQINMILLHTSAIITPQKYEFVSLDEPTAKTGGKWLYYERKYWDVFVINKKKAGIAFNTAP